MEFIKVTRPKRDVHTVYIHCSASDNPKHNNASTIDLWHKQRGWDGIGYHFFIQTSGYIQWGRNLEIIPAAQKGYNTGSIAICLHGKKERCFTEKQFLALRYFCISLQMQYNKKLLFKGHCEVSPKTCPVFDYKKVLALDIKHQLQSKKMLLPEFNFEVLRGMDAANIVLEVYK